MKNKEVSGTAPKGGDDDIVDLLRETMRGEYAPDLPESVIDKLLTLEPECPPGSAARIHALFVAKVFRHLSPEPVVRLDRTLTLKSSG